MKLHVQREEIYLDCVPIFDAIDAYIGGDEDVAEALGWPDEKTRRRLGDICNREDGLKGVLEFRKRPHLEAIAALEAEYDAAIKSLQDEIKQLLGRAPIYGE
jgi:hypothetical protein